ncbi:AvrD family protein [Streptomyces sp. NPDC006879]|uniref:AvrD family protein n=1 Tax=Streptomyces sp. NPDC006879 TaxID=3364767 RepID=UPI0036AA10EC
MPAARPDQQLRLTSIEDYLGPGENRFFSRGYQRARYTVRDLLVSPATTGPGVRATADIDYPRDWSRKRTGSDLRPHLSTVDALVLGVQLAELHLAHGYGLDGSARRQMRLRKVQLRAGGAPQEILKGVPLAARLLRTEGVEQATGRSRSVHECAVGNLQVRCEIEHGHGAAADGLARYADLTEALGPGPDRFYGEGFQLRRHHIHNVQVDMSALRAEAAVRFEAESDPTGSASGAGQGLEGGAQPAVSLLDAFVVNLQLAQVLLYELDSVSRAQSNTLWMTRTVLEAEDARPRPLPAPFEPPLRAEAALSGKRLLPLRGSTWRSVDIAGSLGGVALRCAFAHELPAAAAASAT